MSVTGCRWTALLAMLLCAGCLCAQTRSSAPPTIRFAKPDQQRTLGVAYQAALNNLLEVNTIPYTAHEEEGGYNQTGLLSVAPDTFFRAGGGYAQPWTRDASVNSWNGGSLVAPEVARNTLWSVVRRDAQGKLIVQQDNQWWDQVIWVIAAWNHFTVTGDRAFLQSAYATATNTLVTDRKLHFNAALGLFQGAAFLNDGIAGYPAPPADAAESQGSFVLAYPGSSTLMPLSTNCLYVGAYRAAAQMAAELHRPASEVTGWSRDADSLTSQIRERFWMPAQGRFGYLAFPSGTLDTSQEGAGLSFALLFQVASQEQAAATLQKAHVEPHGMPDVWPSFPRYSAEHPGRHNVIIWPPIEAFWASAAARSGNVPAFSREVETLAQLVMASDGHFFEIYNSLTGQPDGGWQVGHAWPSQPDQTWSATGYLRMMYDGLFGLRFGAHQLTFAPTLPAGWGDVTLEGLHYRQAVLRVDLRGTGTVVRAFRLDGVEQPHHDISADLRGAHTIEIELGPK